MTEVEFGIQMDRLAKTYGARGYPPEAVKLIWKEAASLSQPAFERIVDKLIAGFRQRPLVEDIRKLSWQERKKNTPAVAEDVAEWAPTKYFCPWCKDTGVYLCQKRDQTGDWAFRCHCDIGTKNNENFPHYKKEHLSLGFFYSDVKTRQ